MYHNQSGAVKQALHVTRCANDSRALGRFDAPAIRRPHGNQKTADSIYRAAASALSSTLEGSKMNNDSLPDYYEDLQVSPNADSETIERVFRLLAKRYHPDNRLTGQSEAFNRISSAYKVLSDAERRAAYDARYGAINTAKWKISEVHSPHSSFENDERLRHRILSILYVERRNDASGSGIGLWRIEQLLGLPESALEFHVWYMKEKGWIQRSDTGGYAITALGVDTIEAGEVLLADNRLLPGPDRSAGHDKRPRQPRAFTYGSDRLTPSPL
jgi:hypothetical protein